MSRGRFLLWYGIAWIPIAVLYSFLIYMQAEPRSVSGAIWGGMQSVAHHTGSPKTAAITTLCMPPQMAPLTERGSA